ncbi:MAG TPA: histidine--tRNA ligase [Candidatus Coatesbacteria bacterium]|nr:histidine--tRNA ligase [Candidatus Coatesbacteria bacterium]
MDPIKPRIFKGTRDFLPQAMIPREDIIDIIRECFSRYGFSPLATPAFEYVDILTGKSGGEVDKLIYPLAYRDGRTLALHYDLTVPLARVMAMYPELPTPFKRYQIQPVWRADRPQLRQGRFREFVQCDADIVGVGGVLADAEIIALTADILGRLGFGIGERKFLILVNDRRFLAGVVAWSGLYPGQWLAPVCRALDKFERDGMEGVRLELEKLKLEAKVIGRLMQVFEDAPAELRERAGHSKARELLAGWAEVLDYDEEALSVGGLFDAVASFGVPDNIWVFTPWLSRGLDYYTGPIFESVLPSEPHIGSLTGGGRYDGLIGRFGERDIPATGTTIGIDRIFAAMEQLGIAGKNRSRTQVLVANFGADTLPYELNMVAEFRNAGLATEIFLEPAKLAKQFRYADKLGIPVVAVIGPEEADKGMVKLKWMDSGLEEVVARTRAVYGLKEKLEMRGE